jgi:hypothetical protein
MADTTVPSKVADETAKEQETKLSSTTTEPAKEETTKDATKETTSDETKPVCLPCFKLVKHIRCRR